MVGCCKGSGDISTSGILDIEGADACCLLINLTTKKPIRTSMYHPNTNERNPPVLSSYFAHNDLGQIMLAWHGLVNPLVFEGPGLRVLYDVK